MSFLHTALRHLTTATTPAQSMLLSLPEPGHLEGRWKHPTCSLTWKNVSIDAAGVGKHCAQSGKEWVPGCQLMLSMRLCQCYQPRKCWGLPTCKEEWKIQSEFWCHTCCLRGLGWSSAESNIPLSFRPQRSWLPLDSLASVYGSQRRSARVPTRMGSRVAALKVWSEGSGRDPGLGCVGGGT